MRLILFLIFASIVAAKVPSPLPLCSTGIIKNAFPPKIFFETTIDGNIQNVLVTRLFHNKVGIYGSEFARCYFYPADPTFFYQNIGIVGLIGILVFAYKSILQRRLILLTAFILWPLISIFSLPYILFVFTYKIFAIIGLLFLFKLK